MVKSLALTNPVIPDVSQSAIENIDASHNSSLEKLLRVTAIRLRFVNL